jgi:predicted ATP-dependent protease
MARTQTTKESKLVKLATPKGLEASACTITTNLDAFDFETTESVETLESVIEQDRAVRSLELGLSITRPNYHVYVAGPSGTGKRSQLKSMLKRIAPDRKQPNDWVYLHNFSDEDTPLAIGLKPGEGRTLKAEMEKLLEGLTQGLPAAFHSREHQEKLQHTVSQGNISSTDAFVALSRKAEKVGFIVRANKNDELITLPIVDGKTLSDKEIMALAEDERKKLDRRREQLEPLFTEFVQSNRQVEQSTQAKIASLQKDLGERIARPLFKKVREQFRSGGKKLSAFLEALYQEVLAHMERFLPEDERPQARDQPGPDPFVGFRVNLVVENGQTEGAPVVFETHPTYYRLFGKVERRVEQGIYFTDHTMIRAGSFARANGGYLICHAADLFQFPGVWENLKATLRNAEVAIEDLGETAGLLPTSGLKPEPIPLSVKLVLIGSNALYHTLYRADDDFKKIFQIKADFDYEIRRSQESVANYVRFIATAAKNNGCRPIDKDGVAAVIEHGSRLVDSQRKLTLRFNQLSNLMVEADYFASKGRSRTIQRKHIERAIAQRTLSSSLIADKMHEDLLDDQWLLESSGTGVGVINGLAVLSVGEHQFGRPFRVTARSFAGSQGIVNIEREVQMSGEIHDKGVQILSGFLGDRFAQRRPLCLTATVTFEQSYGEVDGDSASSTWLYAILSAVSGVAIDQGIGVTGSVNQLGQIQPIGGVNEKIEGFFRFCQARRLTGKQGVIIPWQNVQHLVLSREVREAIAKDKFHVWPISTVEAGIEILTSVKAGVMRPDGTYPPGTLMRQVQDRLDELRKHADLARSAGVRKTAIPSAAVRAARRHSDESEWPDEVGDRARGSRR